MHIYRDRCIYIYIHIYVYTYTHTRVPVEALPPPCSYNYCLVETIPQMAVYRLTVIPCKGIPEVRLRDLGFRKLRAPIEGWCSLNPRGSMYSYMKYFGLIAALCMGAFGPSKSSDTWVLGFCEENLTTVSFCRSYIGKFLRGLPLFGNSRTAVRPENGTEQTRNFWSPVLAPARKPPLQWIRM